MFTRAALAMVRFYQQVSVAPQTTKLYLHTNLFRIHLSGYCQVWCCQRCGSGCGAVDALSSLFCGWARPTPLTIPRNLWYTTFIQRYLLL